VEKTNYFTVEVYGAQARACFEYLAKGSRVMVDELDWREWTEQNNNRREAVTLRARRVTFESGRARTDTSQDSSERLIASSQAAAPLDGVTAGDVSAGVEDLPF
jgi:single-stranded DNA-binding protein